MFLVVFFFVFAVRVVADEKYPPDSFSSLNSAC